VDAHRNSPNDTPRLIAEGWRRAGISRSLAYELMAAGRFPRPIKIGTASRFVTDEIDAWIDARVAERDGAQGVSEGAAPRCADGG